LAASSQLQRPRRRASRFEKTVRGRGFVGVNYRKPANENSGLPVREGP
jgi:hypothetical protein